MATKEIKTRIQLIRKDKSVLEAANPQTLNGEIYIVLNADAANNTKIKIGNGDLFNTLPYYEDSLLATLGLPINIQELADKQILMYNGTTEKWENVELSDDKSIIYVSENGLSIKGYNEASQGYMLVKDINQGLAWIKPLDETTLNQKVAEAAQHATNAGNYATAAGNSAIAADTSAKTAQRINEQTMAWVNDKFWWGSIEEYNKLTEITEGTFYFVQL